MTAHSDLSGRLALITGGGKGIGAAIAYELGRRGADVAINYRADADAADLVVARLRDQGRRAVAVGADISDPDGVPKLIDDVHDALGPVDLLVNNAAYTRIMAPEELTLKLWRKMFAANVDAPFQLTWALKGDLQRSGHGAVLNISSMASLHPDPTMIAYGASKAALNSLTASAAVAFARDGIRINAIAAGFTRTPRVDTIPDTLKQTILETVPIGRMADPDEIARTAGFLLSDEASYITGQVIAVSGGA
jgi:NAD(P)-dependent dehydrogenase (short-subunit alcohol dehydrogenase family)